MFEDIQEQLNHYQASGDWPALSRTAHRLGQAVLATVKQGLLAKHAIELAAGEPRVTGERYLVTGGAGFIGSHLARRLLAHGHRVVAADEFNDYYDPILKWDNVADLFQDPRFSLHQVDIRDAAALRELFTSEPFDVVIHLAARAGVRPSIVDPALYVTSNVLGTQNLLELVKEFKVPNFVYASSSSVYGGSTEIPFTESQNVDNPISPYAATKKANEIQAACYSRLYQIPMSGLRFFTVYGPGGRPDMAVRLFIEKMDRGEAIPLYGDGSFERDYTYIDDIVDGILGVIQAANGRNGWNEIFNLGESDTTSVLQLVLLIAKELGVMQIQGNVKGLTLNEQKRLIDELTARGLITRLPEQLGDVPLTHANIEKACQVASYRPQVNIVEGIRRTVRWHLERKRRAIEPTRERLRQALSIQCNLRVRAGLDSFGRQKEPNFEPSDARNLTLAIAELGSLHFSPLDEPLAFRAQVELSVMLREVAQCLARQRSSESDRMECTPD
jgi:UDP-glucuronate 4-epimerase